MFRKVAWSYNTNIYEVNVRQYTSEGTFRAFAGHMPRLKDMGVEVLWFMPITPISIKGRKGTLGSYYACSNYTDINPEFGTLEDFRWLVSYAHQLGFKVMIDWVANHTGLDHQWTIEHPEYYLQNEHGGFYDKHGWDDVIDLNYYNSGLRRAMIDSMKFWVETCGIDGFRCDMAHLVPLDFWREARGELDAIRPLFWLAESDEPAYHEAFDASYTWVWMHKSHDFCKRNMTLPELKKVLLHQQERFPRHAFRCYFTTNHDENSWNGTEFEKFGPAAKVLAVFSSTWNGIPITYSGQEIPNNRRLRFFEKDQIDWNKKPEFHDFYKQLFNLRKTHPALQAGDVSETRFIETNADDFVMVYERTSGDDKVIVALNFSDKELTAESAEWRFSLKPFDYLILEK